MEARHFGLGAHTLPYRAEPLDRALQGIAAAGFPLVGLFREHAGGPALPVRHTAAEAAALRNRIETFGLTPVSMFARTGATADQEALVADIRVCSEMGIPILQALGPWPFSTGLQRKPEMQWYGEVERFLAVLAAGAPEAERSGVTIVLKPHRGATATGADIVDVVGRIGSPAVRACWDAGNVRYYEGLDSEDDLERSGVAPLVRSVCIKDHSGHQMNESFPIPGDGDVDHPRMLRILAAAGFEGPLLVERFDQPDTEANDAGMVRSYRYLESVVREMEQERGAAV